MIRSLFSGASGMKNHQIRMDVIGNNVANVNTTGFKGSRTNFQDILYQTVRYPSAGDGTIGGVNPSQVGLGVMVSSITNNTGEGAPQTTGRSLDLYINGNGWFVLSTDGNMVDGTGQTNEAYTREGIFYIDNVGNLVNSSGYNLCDVDGNPITLDVSSSGVATINIEKDGYISYSLLDGTEYEDAFQIGLAMFPNQDGLERDGLNIYRISPTSGEVSGGAYGAPNSGGYGEIDSGFLEMSNVDLTDEFVNMITTQRGYQANARTVTTSDQILEELLNIKR
ncbi:flagellar hook-basal body complex protein [Pelotomaculum terephthalicicum JT]|uniref:flagellar hook-basal body complex protein n=1 Tax=Pelotomaculum terephthalicicum TaxID=206393 RepID=UPI001F046FE3|nr:flagellar hook-basal body complex protein [Pelotomaculum terephthalicicum]MCG9967974.1 flagellar hook-basal body complex protein [Pelotomaculum terephthalicicum JT]